jgi:hypothetical protein
MRSLSTPPPYCSFRRVSYFFVLAALLLLVLIRRNIQPAGAAIRFEETSKEALILLDLKS